MPSGKNKLKDDNAKHHQIAHATQCKAALETVPQVLSHPALPIAT